MAKTVLNSLHCPVKIVAEGVGYERIFETMEEELHQFERTQYRENPLN